jgi:hypothetical protein
MDGSRPSRGAEVSSYWTPYLKGSQNPKNYKQNASILALKVDFFSCAFAAKACGFHAFAVAQGFRRIKYFSIMTIYLPIHLACSRAACARDRGPAGR